MKLLQSCIPEVVIIEPTVYEDERGWFLESFNEERFHSELKKLNLPVPSKFVQDNHSCSKKGVLRGLHFQLAPHAQGKLVRVVNGAAFDVVVDIRPKSPTFGQIATFELSAKNQRMVWIPEGFAHGFVALEDNTHFLYKTTDFYNKESEGSIHWNDPTLAIKWPLKDILLINEKDNSAPLFTDAVKTNLTRHGLVNSLINLRVIGDDRGSLIALEKNCNLPFDIKRSYYIYATKPDVSRGYHAHVKLQQLAVCVTGKCRMVLDNGTSREEFWLDSPEKGLLINNMTWREMHDFSEDCVLVVFASEQYDEDDYIRDYDEFIKGIINE